MEAFLQKNSKQRGGLIGDRPVDRLVDEHFAADFLCQSVKTLRKRRWAGDPPEYVKLGRSVRYRLSVLEAFVESCSRRSTTDSGSRAA
jgi:hypothetical protein